MTDSKLEPLHAGISIANMQASIAWYEEVLDFQLMWCKDLHELKSKIAFLKNDFFSNRIV